jgi:hypothetical protein
MGIVKFRILDFESSKNLKVFKLWAFSNLEKNEVLVI